MRAMGLMTTPLLDSLGDTSSFEMNFEIVALLLDKGADPNVTNSSGTTPLARAFNHYHDKRMMHLLIAYGAITTYAQRRCLLKKLR